MAQDDKTEKPTPKRKKEARRKGQIARSPDVSSWFIMLAASMIIPMLFKSADAKLKSLINQSVSVMQNPSPAGSLVIMEKGLTDVLALTLPVVGAFAVIGVAANVAQAGLAFSTHALAPKWNKLNPMTGVKNIFSAQSAWQLAKQLIKLIALVGIAYSTVHGMGTKMVGATPALGPVVSYTGNRLISLVREVSAAGVVLALADYGWQKRKLNRTLKMTKHEVKEEFKQQEGDRLVKGQIRKRQYSMSRSRMMAAVVGADVIVVNPTHYAVALKYEASRGMAPVVVAKGMDELALRIRDVGRQNKVPVVEDPPLARAVYAACDIDQSIPPELFLAVARLLAFVFTLSPIVKAAGLIHRRPSSALVA
ncbi:MAG TPA: flagellar biosynthesis protein FlhB [Acidimicrobiales bacterium]|nr:flagellar biosynthesis protein FlhB [Acidimicrobiales bacterium]